MNRRLSTIVLSAGIAIVITIFAIINFQAAPADIIDKNNNNNITTIPPPASTNSVNNTDNTQTGGKNIMINLSESIRVKDRS